MYDMGTFYEAKSVQEAVELRLAHPEADIIAGGTDVLVQMREGRRAGKSPSICPSQNLIMTSSMSSLSILPCATPKVTFGIIF